MPRVRVGQLEVAIAGLDREAINTLLASETIDDHVLRAALTIKRLAGEVNVLVHALGILLSLKHILEPDEILMAVSLGAGTGGRRYDLETDRRIAEFKFTRWRGHDAVRQNELFADFVYLAESADSRRRQLFVAGLTLPRKFLTNSKRSLASVCQRRPDVLARIKLGDGMTFQTVSEYTAARFERVELVDLEHILPAYLVDQVQLAASASPRADEL